MLSDPSPSQSKEMVYLISKRGKQAYGSTQAYVVVKVASDFLLIENKIESRAPALQLSRRNRERKTCEREEKVKKLFGIPFLTESARGFGYVNDQCKGGLKIVKVGPFLKA
ncbi:hypothetical protein L596_007560 [Steinernema carpocapsae]|uniref:Uncharacterized protein n=1 Tax=Steinernema carpocapsae TaxID=34508 RepID=A0A4U5P9P9_STECR|nr:hypothetical protein L596_007560 [Steinernema carpocapsae]